MVYGPLAFGLLSGAFTADTTFGSNDWRSTGGRPAWNVGVFAESTFSETCELWKSQNPSLKSKAKRCRIWRCVGCCRILP